MPSHALARGSIEPLSRMPSPLPSYLLSAPLLSAPSLLSLYQRVVSPSGFIQSGSIAFVAFTGCHWCAPNVFESFMSMCPEFLRCVSYERGPLFLTAVRPLSWWLAWLEHTCLAKRGRLCSAFMGPMAFRKRHSDWRHWQHVGPARLGPTNQWEHNRAIERCFPG